MNLLFKEMDTTGRVELLEKYALAALPAVIASEPLQARHYEISGNKPYHKDMVMHAYLIAEHMVESRDGLIELQRKKQKEKHYEEADK